MDRRSFLQGSLAATAMTASGPIALADAARVPIGSLRQAIAPSDGVVLAPSDGGYKVYQRYAAANTRVARRPAARVVIKTREGAAAAVNWLRDNGVPFAIRGGGHCYEDFSQSDAVALDLRGLADVSIAEGGGTVSVGAGALLGEVYTALTAQGRLIPAGSCPQVGVAGHVQGGGYGLFSRKFGLACDSLIGAELVDAKGKLLTVSDTENKDLLWALRGGGGGSFGLVTRFIFRTHKLSQASRFAVDFGSGLDAGAAAKALKAWQVFAHAAPREITLLVVVGASAGAPTLNCFGLSTNTDEAWLRQQLAPLVRETKGVLKSLITQPVVDQIAHFAGAPHHLTGSITDTSFFMPTFYKGKSDVVTDFPLEAATALVKAVAANGLVAAICDPYGGAIADLADEATAFAHRSKTLFNIQYITQSSSMSAHLHRQQLAAISDVYSAMTPYRTGGAYVNYCDLDLNTGDYGAAYWGGNLARLKQIKAAVDPKNLFHHGQSVPV